MKKPLLSVLFSLFLTPLFSQDFKFGTISLEDLAMKEYANDTSAQALVLKEFGETYLSNETGNPLVHKYHVKIKIFNTKAFNEGNILIPIYKSDNNRFEKVSEIRATTFSLNEFGGMQQTALDVKKVYQENKNEHWDHIKFAMPNLKPGCIVEYSYELRSPYIWNFRTWNFQSHIPKIYSEYLAHIPAVYNYNVSLKGALKLKGAPKVELEKECFTPGGGFKADCSKITYVMEDIPAFVEEDYMTAPVNFRSAINFELSDYVDYRGTKFKVTKEWKDIDYDLKKHDFFGNQIQKKDLFKDKIPAVIATSADETSKAKAVFKYIQSWYKWNGFRSIYSENGIRKAFDAHSGNVADINLSLISALNFAGLNTEAVLLSTRENGVVNKLYPVVSDFDYVVAKVNIGSNSYLLDATDPLLPFGLLPLRCINDQGRVISLDKPSFWIDLTASQKESKSYTLNLNLEEDGKIKGNITGISKGYEAYYKRSHIKKFNSLDEYVENLDENWPKTKILKSEIRNIDDLDQPLTEVYEVEINAYDNLEKEKLIFNPYFMDKKEENPFKLNERNYPVDMGAPSEVKVILSMSFPDKFEIIAQPEKVGLALPEGGGRFITSSIVDTNRLQFSQLTEFTKPIYSPDEYPYLKELYNKIVQQHKTDFIFKKK